MRYETKNTIKIIFLVCLWLLFALVLSGVAEAAAKSCEDGNAADCLNSNSAGSVMALIVVALNFLAGAVGVVAVIMLIVAGIQYSAAGDKPEAIQGAKQKIYNVLIGLASFFLLYSFFQWLIPGGVGL